MEPIHTFFQLIETRTTRELQALQQKGRLYTQIELILTGLAVLFAIGALILVQHRVLTPVQVLVEGAQGVEQGNYSQRVNINTSDEMGILSRAFNRMIEGLQRDITVRMATEAQLRQREHEFRQLIEHSPVPLVVTTLEHTQYVNPKFTDTFGYTLEEIPTPDAWAERAYPEPVYRREVMTRRWARFTEALQTQTEFQPHSDIKVTCKNGDQRHIDMTASTIGEQYLVALHDITDLKRAEDALRQSEEKFRRIVEGLKDDYIFYSFNSDDVLTYVSPSIETVLGYTQEEAYANNYTAYLTDNPINFEAARIYQAEFETGKSALPYEMEFYHKRSDTCIFEVLDTLVFDTEGQVVAIEEIARDVTQRKQVEVELKRARDAAEAANEAKSTFLATMSHEIRTPMNAIINMTGLALETELTHRQQQYLTVVHSAANNLLALINDILDFSKIEAGRMELEIVPFHLRTLLEEITEAFRAQVLEKKIEFVVHVGMDIPDHLVGDTLRLRQVLINLIGNAFKFTDQGEVVLLVSLVKRELPTTNGDQQGAAQLRFSVRDTGIGIPQNRHDQLFDAFEQADRSTSRKFGGTGLGLAISQRLVAIMGGELQLESEISQGSEFFFTTQFEVASDETRSMRVPPGIDRLRVLVIDDNASARDLLATLLEQFGMSYVLAESAEEGLGLLHWSHEALDRTAPFDLLLLDWQLPGVDGLEATRQLRGQVATANLPIIMISAFAGIEEERQAQALGINAFVPKPITASSLFDAIINVFQVGHPQRSVCRQWEFDEQEFVGRRILLAEDNEANQFVAIELLSRAGILLDIAENGRVAFERVRQHDYDVVLMDMQMPEMDGLEATRRIRDALPDRRLPIIALTANAMKGDLEVCLEAGMDDYLAKPIDRQQLFRTLRKWLPALSTAASASTHDMTATAMPVAEPAVDLPELPGIDMAEALQRLGLSVTAYETILFRFADSETKILAGLQAAFESEDWETVQRQAHALAGAAGNVSANALHALAKQLEVSSKDQTEGTIRSTTTCKLRRREYSQASKCPRPRKPLVRVPPLPFPINQSTSTSLRSSWKTWQAVCPREILKGLQRGWNVFSSWG